MLRSSPGRTHKNINNKQGLILMVSLWILAIISLLCVGLAHRVVVNLKLAKFQKDRLQCLYIAKAGIQKAINVIEHDETSDYDTLNELWSAGIDKENKEEKSIFKEIRLGNGFFTVSYVYDDKNSESPVYFYGMSDEDRKININSASRELLMSLFDVMQVNDPEGLSQNIIYWRGDTPQGYEDPYYESEEIPYSARQAPFKTIEELYLVKGFRENPDLVKNCEDFFTVYTGNNLVNVNTASYSVLKAIFASLGADQVGFGLSDKLANNIIDYRNGPDNQEATDDDEAIPLDEIRTILNSGLNIIEEGWVNNQDFPFTAKSNLFRIEVSAWLDNSKIKKDIAVVLNRSAQPIRIVYWHEK